MTLDYHQIQKKLLEKALIIAKKLGHSEIAPEHLFLALLSDKDFSGYKILTEIGVDPEQMKEQIHKLFSSPTETIKEVPEQSPQPAQDDFFPPELQEMGESFFGKALTALKQPKNKNSALDYFTIDLTEKARQGKLDPIVGRKPEIERMLRILNRRTKNNPVFVGEPGVGKTAIVEGLAQQIVSKKVPHTLADKKILILDLALLLAGTKYRGEFEERIKKVTEEIIQAKDTIIFIDELHTMVGAGSAEGAMDAANILKPALARGDLRLIGATTIDDYRKYIEKDPALERRLQIIKVDEPTPEETLQILIGIRKKFEDHHNVKISDEALQAAVDLSKRYISDRFMPDKAVDLIDEAASAAALFETKEMPELVKLKRKYTELEKEKEEMVASENFKKALQIKSLQENIKIQVQKAKSKKGATKFAEIAKEDIAKIVSDWTKIPLSSLISDDIKKFKNLDKILKAKIKGQDEAVKTIADSIRRSKTGVTSELRPLGSFMFLGPTGVGKTELAKVLASEVFESPEALIKVDMSEFMEKHNVSRLVGAPPGYVGYEESGKLTEAVRRRPYSVVLLDEIEKAHPDIQNILLQILEDGYLTDAKGRRVNFRNTIIIMTSNIGMKELTTQAVIGFKSENLKKQDFIKSYDHMKEKVLRDLKGHFRPEFLNRVDKVLVFKPLDEKEISQIVDLQILELIDRLKGRDIKLKITVAAKKKIAEIGFDPEHGARPIRRAISDLIEDPLSEAILKSNVKKGKLVTADIKDGKIKFK